MMRQPRVKHPKHLEMIRDLPCLICRGRDCEAAHVRYGSLIHGKRPTGAGEKSDDRWTVPLCPGHHRSQHATGEKEWWRDHNINPLVVAALLYSHLSAGNHVAADVVARHADQFPFDA